MAPHDPLWKRRICGVPYVLPKFKPQLAAVVLAFVDTCAQVRVDVAPVPVSNQSPITKVDALVSANTGPAVSVEFAGLLTLRAKISAPPGPMPPTRMVCQAPPQYTSPVPGVASTSNSWPYCGSE